MKSLPYALSIVAALLLSGGLAAQSTLPVNGVFDERSGLHAFEHATLVISPERTLTDATLLIRDGFITAAGQGISVPADAVRHDCSGQFLYPSFIELQSSFGIPEKTPQERETEAEALETARKGAWAWNEALLPEYDAVQEFSADDKMAGDLRASGFGAVLSHRRDGIAQGTGAVVLLHPSGREHEAIVRERAAAFYSFRKGSSTQNYPSSLMGAIALLRQTYLDGKWYAAQIAPRSEVNLSLEAWNRLQQLPSFFESGDHLSSLRAARLGAEFQVSYTLLGDGSEYKSLEQLAATGLAVVVPVNFPKPYLVSDPLDANLIAYPEMLHWEMAPANPALLRGAGVRIAISSQGLEEPAALAGAVRKAIEYGLSNADALAALTTEPARLAGVSGELGTLEQGKRANFLRCSGPLFEEDTRILENWVGGTVYRLAAAELPDHRGSYTLQAANRRFTLKVEGEPGALQVQLLKDSVVLSSEGQIDRERITMAFSDEPQHWRLSGWWLDGKLSGIGENDRGERFDWTAIRTQPFTPEPDTSKEKKAPRIIAPKDIPHPFQSYGNLEQPKQEEVLFRNATVWTNGNDGVMPGSDVHVKNGRIVKVGKGLRAPDAREVDATGMHLTAGIIDEHSHIAVSNGVNEGSQASSAEVRIGDVVDPGDIDIYRQLSGGVVAAQLLHGSANPVGGQSALIKLRWGLPAEQMKIEGAAPFIKFALGENVKQSNWGDNMTIRFPQTRMGVEQVYVDLFTRAGEYGKRKAAGDPTLRPDLELDALYEILQKQRFITCHSYVQSEINMLMKVAERFGFRINTFTHILEGYKVADKMREHGVGASTFSDWWAYKYEVIDAIPHNAAILQRMGVVTAINSDDAEMGRRLNQEAAKAVKYGGISEEEAWKMVTLNPAKLLHLDDRMGSVEAGKDADIVLWSDNPLSVYAVVNQTWIDGRCYFSLEKDKAAQQQLRLDRSRLIAAMMDRTAAGEAGREPEPEHEHNYHCDDMEDECAGN